MEILLTFYWQGVQIGNGLVYIFFNSEFINTKILDIINVALELIILASVDDRKLKLKLMGNIFIPLISSSQVQYHNSMFAFGKLQFLRQILCS